MEWIILRPPSVFGPRDEQFLPLFKAVVGRGIYPRFGAAGRTYSYIYVKDLARALLQAGCTESGVNSTYFLKSALNEIRKHNGLPELDAMEFLNVVRERMKVLDLNEDLLRRSVNEGFSGGEKKRNEIIQMAVLEPKLAVLDETDSGLDIDALKIVSIGVNKLRRPENAQLVITHYQRLLNYIVPDFVHVLADGRILRTGGKELALQLEEKGYDWIMKEEAVPA